MRTRPGPAELVLRLDHLTPFDQRALLDFLAARAVPGVEEVGAGAYRRTLRLPHAAGRVQLEPHADHVLATLRLDDPRDLAAAVEGCRRLLDLDTDPVAVAATLRADPLLAPLVAARPGLRVPGHVDGFELAVRAILGQQVSVAGARTLAGRLVAALGTRLEPGGDGPRMRFPEPAAVATADLRGLGLTGARVEALRALAAAVAAGRLDLAPGADRAEAEAGLLALPGVGPWTAAYVAMRALGDRDALPAADLGLRRALERLGAPSGVRDLRERAERWRPWRAYGVMHLWSSLSD
jgi:AraC family transcriptional regulator, regulatory protein of adaptative response / DNA-3-methyladenine glycosylase II